MDELERLADLLEDTLPGAMHAVMRVLSEDCRPFGVSLQQMYLLRLLQKRGPCTAATIGEILGITSGPVTNVTRRLAGLGLIRQSRDAYDRRVHWFVITDQGEALIGQVSVRRKALWRNVFSEMGVARSTEIVQCIGRLGERLATARAESGPVESAPSSDADPPSRKA